ncbi:MAG: cytochrome C [Rhodobacteraceae bacterium]|nr:MAG: cytochrome C [Paracoccaceae bacterium]
MNHQIFRLPVLVILAMTLAFSTLGLTAQEQITNKDVKKRVALMLTAQAAMETLTDMMAGQVMFQANQARSARRTLIQTSDDIAKRFKTPHFDPLSNARPEIWTYWADFKARAASSEAAARQLNVYSLNGLRRSLPSVLQSCLSCHDSYRAEPNEFITH